MGVDQILEYPHANETRADQRRSHSYKSSPCKGEMDARAPSASPIDSSVAPSIVLTLEEEESLASPVMPLSASGSGSEVPPVPLEGFATAPSTISPLEGEVPPASSNSSVSASAPFPSPTL